MIATPNVSQAHHARLMPGVDALAEIGDLVGSVGGAELRPRLDATHEFLHGLLLPHMEAAERALYTELERLMQNRHSMTPMRREHETIRVAIDDLDRLCQSVPDGRLPTNTGVALRRTVFRLYVLLKVHLAEEQLYADIVEHGLTPDAEAALGAAMQHEGVGAL